MDRTRAIVLTDAWGPLDFADIDESENERPTEHYRRVNELATELGREVAGLPASLNLLLPDLVHGAGARLWAFGSGLAQAEGNRLERWLALVEAVRKTPLEQRNHNAICGFIAGLHQAEPQLCTRLLDSFLDDPDLEPWLPVAQSSVPINSDCIQRLVRSLQKKTTSVANFSVLAGGRCLDELDLNEFAVLIDSIRKKPKGFSVACDILSMRLHTADSHQVEKSKFGEIGRAILQDIEFSDNDNMQDYRLTEIAKVSLHGTAGEVVAATICTRLRSALERHEIFHLEPDQFVRTLFSLQPAVALNNLIGDLPDAKIGSFLIHSMSGRHDNKNPLDVIPDEVVIQWCNRRARPRFKLMSGLISFCRATADGRMEWTPLALKMLEGAPNPKVVLSNFIDRFSPSSWEGSRADIVEKNIPLLDQLRSDLDQKLKQFLLQKRLALRKEIDRCREWESRQLDRDESFE